MVSAELVDSFEVNALKNCSRLTTLSVFKGKVLTCCMYALNFWLGSPNGDNLIVTSAVNSAQIFDIIWTPRGNILYACDNGTDEIAIVVLSDSIKLIAIHTLPKSRPFTLSCSNDGNIYITTGDEGFYQSADDGISWNVLNLRLFDGWQSMQFFKLSANNYDYIWTTEMDYYKSNIARNRVYIVNRKKLDSNMIYKNINNISTGGKQLCPFGCLLSYDGCMNIFMTNENKTVYVSSINGESIFQLLPPVSNDEKTYYRLGVDVDSQLLVAGESNGAIKVFKLTYESR